MLKKLALGVLLLVGCGCDSMSNTDKGLLAGGGLGAAAGAGLGSLSGHAGAGALLGGVVGAIAGGLTGSAVDRQEERAELRAVAAANARPPLTLTDVVAMSQQHISDDLIIQQIRTTYSVYNLTADDVTWLKQQGVSDLVVAEMQARRPGYVYAPAGYVRPVYVVEDPPPVHVGIGVGYCGHFR